MAAAVLFQAGEQVVYQSASQGPVRATVLAGPHPDGSYDLDCKPKVPPARIARASAAVAAVAVAPEAFAAGEVVVYQSATQGPVHATVVAGPYPDGTYDLDCKPRVPPGRIQRPSSRPSAMGSCWPQQPPLEAEPCFCRDDSGEWRPAQMLRSHPEDGTYDLDSRERVRPEDVHWIREGDVLEYHSASANRWISARVLRRGRVPGTFDLDCKESVSLERMRPCCDVSQAQLRQLPTQPQLGAPAPCASADGRAAAWLPLLPATQELEWHAAPTLDSGVALPPPEPQQPEAPMSRDSIGSSVAPVVVDVEAFFPGQPPPGTSPPPTAVRMGEEEQAAAKVAMQEAAMRRDPEALQEAIHHATSLGVAGPEVSQSVEMLRAMGGRLQRRPLSTAGLGSARGHPGICSGRLGFGGKQQEQGQQGILAQAAGLAARVLGTGDGPGLATQLLGPLPPDGCGVQDGIRKEAGSRTEGPGLVSQLLGPATGPGLVTQLLGPQPQEGAGILTRLLGPDRPRCSADASAWCPGSESAALTDPKLGQGPGGRGTPVTQPQLHGAPELPQAVPVTNPQLGPGGTPGAPPATATEPQLTPGAGTCAAPATDCRLGQGSPSSMVPSTDPRLHPESCASSAPGTEPRLVRSNGSGTVPVTDPRLHPESSASSAPGTEPRLCRGSGGAAVPVTDPRLHPESCASSAPGTEPRLDRGSSGGTVLATDPRLHTQSCTSSAPGTDPRLSLGNSAGMVPATDPRLHPESCSSAMSSIGLRRGPEAAVGLGLRTESCASSRPGSGGAPATDPQLGPQQRQPAAADVPATNPQLHPDQPWPAAPAMDPRM